MEVAWLVDAPDSPLARALEAHVRVLRERHDIGGGVFTRDAPTERFDVAVATSSQTCEALFRAEAPRRALLVHDLEERRFAAGTPERAMARLALDLPVVFLAARAHVAEALAALRPDAPCHRVRLGIERGPEPSLDGDASPLRVLAHGARAGDVLRQAAGVEPAASLAEAQVVLHLDAPADPLAPLAAFAVGATCVAAETAGVDELVEHGVNGLLCEPDDGRGPTRQLELLARDRALLHRLREGALATARAWPTTGDAAAELAAALTRIAQDAPPDPAPAAAAMLADLRGTLEQHRAVLDERDTLARRLEPVERFAANPVVRRLLARRRRS